MKVSADSIYLNSPVSLQKLWVLAYGVLLQNQRHGGNHRGYVEFLRSTDRLGREQVRAMTDSLLRIAVSHAFATVPFYRELEAKGGVRSKEIRTVTDLVRLPVIEKRDLQQRLADFRSQSVAERGVFWMQTSGTTGTTLRIPCDHDSRRFHYAFWARLRGWFGIGPGDKRATFFGRAIRHPDATRPPFWHYDRVGRNLLCSSYHLSAANLPFYYRRLAEYRPAEIIGYPSSLYPLARYVRENGLPPLAPRCTITTAETLLPHQREAIEEAFGAPVVDQYGCTEMALFVSQCERGSYHVHPEHGIVEVLDSRGEPCRPGEVGEAVCTSFANRALPLIRYRLGDALEFSEDDCPCGRGFPVLRQIVGRLDDVIRTPDGRRIGRISMKGIGGVHEAQFIQTRLDTLEVLVACRPERRSQAAAEVDERLRMKVGKGMKLDIRFVEEIAKDRHGKFRSIVSKLEERA